MRPSIFPLVVGVAALTAPPIRNLVLVLVLVFARSHVGLTLVFFISCGQSFNIIKSPLRPGQSKSSATSEKQMDTKLAYFLCPCELAEHRVS